jgi:hypothetical protein
MVRRWFLGGPPAVVYYNYWRLSDLLPSDKDPTRTLAPVLPALGHSAGGERAQGRGAPMGEPTTLNGSSWRARPKPCACWRAEQGSPGPPTSSASARGRPDRQPDQRKR